MDTGEVYREYLALKAHFSTPKYDYFKYGGKIRGGDVSKRRDKHFFFKLSRALNDKQIIDYFVANILNDNVWIGNMSKESMNNWRGIMNRLPEILEQDIKYLRKIDPDVQSVFKLQKPHPELFQFLLGGFIRIETVVILNRYIKFIEAYNEAMKDDVLWTTWSQKIHKYTPFVYHEMKDYTDIDFGKLLKKLLLNKS